LNDSFSAKNKKNNIMKVEISKDGQTATITDKISMEVLIHILQKSQNIRLDQFQITYDQTSQNTGDVRIVTVRKGVDWYQQMKDGYPVIE